MEETYDLKEDILALDWQNTPTEELRLYLTQTSEMYVGAYLSVMDETEREEFCVAAPIMREMVTKGTLIYDDEQEAFIPVDEYSCTYEESCIETYEEALSDGLIVWAETESQDTEDVADDQKMLTVGKDEECEDQTAELSVTKNTRGAGLDRGKWIFPTAGADGSEMWFYMSNADRSTTIRYIIRGLAGHDMTDGTNGLRFANLSYEMLCERGNAFQFFPKIDDIKVYRTGVSCLKSWWYTDEAMTNQVDDTYNAAADVDDQEYIAQEQVLCGLSVIFKEIQTPRGYYYDPNRINVYAYGTNRPAYAWNYMYRSNGSLSDFYETSDGSALRAENRFNFNKLWENLYGKAIVWKINPDGTAGWEPREYRGFSRISNESSFTGDKMTVNCDIMFLPGTRLIDASHPSYTATRAERSEIILAPVPKTYTVTADANWGTLNDYINGRGDTNITSFQTEYDKNYYDDISRLQPKRAGYVFKGWWTDRDGGTQVWDENGLAVKNTGYWNSNGNWIYDGDVTVYAHWEQCTTWVVFDANWGELYDYIGSNGGGWTNVTSTYLEYGQNYYDNISRLQPKRDGFVFEGWYIDVNDLQNARDNGTPVWDTSGIAINDTGFWENGVWCRREQSLTAFAHWRPENQAPTVTVNPNGGTWNGSTNIQTFTMNTGDTKDIPDATRDGYRFAGWSLTGAGSSINGKTFKMGTTNATLTAQWNVNTSTLKVNPNGGTWNGSTNVQSFTQNYNTTKEIPVPTRVGYTFTGWKKSNPFYGSITSTTARATYTFGATNGVEDTLTAQWQVNNYNVNLLAGTGIASVTGAGSYPYGSTVNISATLLPGYHWVNWTGSYRSSNINNSFTMPANDVTMTANGEANNYTVIFDPNGGAEVTPLGNIETKYDTDITLPDGAQYYVKYTKDGVNVTDDLLSGALSLDENVYLSVFRGWSLADGRDSFIPQWRVGEVVRNLTEENNGVITLYAVWDDCPWIVAENLYYTLEQAQSGFITQDELLSHATAYDREDGSPILPGFHENGTSFSIPDYSPTDFTQFDSEGSCTENLTVVDSAGSVYAKQITVYIVDTTPVAVKPVGTTRFINEYYYNQPYENGGLEENSIWRTNPEYAAVLQTAFNNLRNDTPVQTYRFTHQDILEMKEFIAENGIGNTRYEDALQRFYDRFMKPELVQ